MNILTSYVNRGIDFVLNQKITRDYIGNDREEIKQKLFYYSNLAFAFAINCVQFAYMFFTSVFNYVFTDLLGNEKELNDTVVLITGSGGYLGRSLALEFAKKQATLVLWDIHEEENKNTLALLNKHNFYNAHLYTVDLSQKQEIENAANRVKSEVGVIYLVIMAGILFS